MKRYVSLKLWFLLIFSKVPAEIPDSNIFLIIHNTLAYLAFSLSATPIQHGQGTMLVLPNQRPFISTFHVGLMFCFFPPQFYIVHIHRQE